MGEMVATPRTKVAFIAGMGRSGSTLISRLLDRVDGVCAVGELCYLWDQGILMNRMCGCGQEFASCPFWHAVGARAFGGWDQVDAQHVLGLRRSVERVRFVPALATGIASSGFRTRAEEYAGVMATVYHAIAEVAGSSVVVDSSKYPSAAYLARRDNAVDLRLIHLVRASQGVAFSWQKVVARPDRDGKPLARFSPARTATEWMAYNLMLEAMVLLKVPRVLVRYEDFIERPAHWLAEMLRVADLDVRPEDLTFVSDGGVELASDHSLAGNPMRFRVGFEELRTDEEWVRAMSPQTRRLVTTLTAPGLLRYHYGIRGGR